MTGINLIHKRSMRKNLFLGLILLAGITGCAPRLGLYRQNSEYRYDMGRTFFYDLRQENDSLHVYLKLTDPSQYKSQGGQPLRLSYLVNLSYERDEIVRRDSVPGYGRRLQVFPGFAFFHFKIPLAGLPLPAVLQLQAGAGPAADMPWLEIPLTRESVAKNFIWLDSTRQLPLFRDYVHTRETFYLQALPAAPQLVVKQYPADFPAALPPFSAARKQVPPVLSLLRTWNMSGQEGIRLREPGLYQLEMGPARAALLVAEYPFPNLTTAPDLIEPLIYLTSAKEREALYKAEEPKIALDRFWLGVANQNKERARQLIKVYYERVKSANQLFSAHKAGWLTDRGMIYIVFGKPDAVSRRQQSEEWVYRQPRAGGPDIKFIFNKKPNTFTQNHYEVERRLEYEFLWYSTVEKWRKGIILED
jgi:GWxTD domain-containing protein